MEISFKGPVMPRPILAVGICGDTKHYTHSKAHYGYEQVSHSKECKPSVRLTVGVFPMVVCRREVHAVATHGLQFRYVLLTPHIGYAVLYACSKG